jgi:hypothetical protein
LELWENYGYGIKRENGERWLHDEIKKYQVIFSLPLVHVVMNIFIMFPLPISCIIVKIVHGHRMI